ncbi:MAG TPA: DCC1-like thiol-disulfide oxidoreductase family protein [Leptospiraceae bacterium]|nr:DCC1-like thiol-disulfide oxidoreductase family protein [Leptospiraceae bacterium]HMY68340.1 DCC1-like thiol-disulfide oxidoreductase family protein [Leptospiraceae bacterium]HMZ59080.1 DCC1-like thiol-disulfide oxidoreductase family protein [Leptospiraceae bacterium]HNF12258.1 DCC1-like thiol-disulfide oxidoreductase family protein [Leptospiraceae bacterium]HNF26026.1 DCC1-like thiol-disulfide oxidoreductase family protein [Leptospiraceae bacterium]
MISDSVHFKIIIMFDGVCNLCNAAVNFLIDHDSQDVFRFVSLQSDTGKSLLEKSPLNIQNIDSVVVIDKNEYYIKSTAVFKIAHFLPFPFSIIKMGRVLPVSFSNRIYDLIASSRYSLFGKKDVCRMPTPEIRAKFLD